MNPDLGGGLLLLPYENNSKWQEDYKHPALPYISYLL